VEKTRSCLRHSSSDMADLGMPKVAVGDAFPMDAVVQVGFKNAMPMSKLFEGKSKVLVVSLPGAFTPT